MDTFTFYQFVLPALLLGAGLVLGLFVEKVVLRQLQRVAVATRWRADNVIVAAFRGIPVFWGAALGIYVATLVSQPDEVFADVLQKLLLVAVLWSITIVGARMSAGLVVAYASRDESFLPATSIIPNLIRLLLYGVGVLVILNELDISITPLLTALGVGGLAVALALQDTLANVFAGLYLLAGRQVRVGDYVRVEEGEEGYIADMNWRSTSIRTIQDNVVILPNSRMASAVVTNFSMPDVPLLMRVPVGVEYDSDLDAVERVTIEAGRETLREATGMEPDEDPRIYFQAFGEFSLNYIVFLRVPEYYDQYRVRSLFIKTLIRRFREAGIALPFPIREFQMELSTRGPGTPARVTPPDAGASPVEGNAPAPRDA